MEEEEKEEAEMDGGRWRRRRRRRRRRRDVDTIEEADANPWSKPWTPQIKATLLALDNAFVEITKQISCKSQEEKH